VEFAFQLCRESAAAEASDRELSAALGNACKMLERIVAHNVLLKCSDCQPTWPRHTALLRFDLPLHRLTTHYVITRKWFLRFFVLRGHHLYYSDGKNGHSDSLEGTLAFMRSNPAPDKRYCVDLLGKHLATCIYFVNDCHAAAQDVPLYHAARRFTDERLRSRLSFVQDMTCVRSLRFARAYIAQNSHTVFCRPQMACSLLPTTKLLAKIACA
jgi:hypothetical protein